MSLIPEFELGLWNAWIFNLPDLLLFPIGIIILRRREMQDVSASELSRKEKTLVSIMVVTLFASYVYSVFLPLKLNTAWFYTGLFIYLLGIIIEIIALPNFATTPIDKPVTKGVYRISRNPMYIGEFLIYIGIGIACASWIFLLIAMVVRIGRNIFVISEERICLEKYGDAYREYIDRTPRWIGIPKSEKRD